MTERINPFKDPTKGINGYLQEILESLSSEELAEYVRHIYWDQEHRSFPEAPSNPYASRSYFIYRTNQHAYNAREILKAREQERSQSQGDEV